jgi:hypothetical protein
LHLSIITFSTLTRAEDILVMLATFQFPNFITLHVVLYGCETWSLKLKEEYTLNMLEDRVLRRIFGPNRNEIIGDCKEMHNEELRDLQSSPSIIRIIESRRMK